MNPGAIEEVGKVATGVIDALRTQPMVIALIVLNFIIIGFVYFSVKDRRDQDHKIMSLLLEQQTKAQELLSRCVVPK